FSLPRRAQGAHRGPTRAVQLERPPPRHHPDGRRSSVGRGRPRVPRARAAEPVDRRIVRVPDRRPRQPDAHPPGPRPASRPPVAHAGSGRSPMIPTSAIGPLEVSLLGLGTSRLASLGSRTSVRAAGNLLDAATDAGINLIDTADTYGSSD